MAFNAASAKAFRGLVRDRRAAVNKIKKQVKAGSIGAKAAKNRIAKLQKADRQTVKKVK